MATHTGLPPAQPSRSGSHLLLISLGLLFIAAAVFSGGADPWPRLVLQWLALALIGMALWEPEGARLGTAEVLLLGAIFLLPLLYLIPLPPSVLALAPGREVFDQTLAVAVPRALEEARPLSLDPFATESAWLTSLIALGVYLATRAMSERHAQQLTYLLFALALVQVIIGLFQFATHTTGVSYELAKLAPRGGAASGTYRNRNHLAGLLEMVIPLALGLFLFHFGRGPKRRRHHPGWHDKLIALLRAGGRPSLAFALLAVIFVVGIVVTRSRSGIAMAMLGMILVAAIFSRHLGGSGSFGLMGRLVTLVIGFALALGLAPVLDRFAWGDMEGDARWRIASASLDGAGTLLPLGSGLGTYPEAFPVQQPIELGKWFINHAHNDYLELLYETGVPGLVLMGVFVVLFLRHWGRQMAGAEWSRFRCLQIGAGIGMTLLLGHGFTDYNLHVPVNLATFAFLAGLFFSPPGRLPVTHRIQHRGRRTLKMGEAPRAGGKGMGERPVGGGAGMGTEGRAGGRGEEALAGAGAVAGAGVVAGADLVVGAGARVGAVASGGAIAGTGNGVEARVEAGLGAGVGAGLESGVGAGADSLIRRPRNPFDVPEIPQQDANAGPDPLD